MRLVDHPSDDALKLDQQILEAHSRLSRAEHDLALLLAEMALEGHHLDLGYASVTQYAQAKLQLEPRKTRALVRIGRALPDLPVLDQAFAQGALCWTKARELLSVVAPDTETEWVELAQRSTSRALERAVSAHAPGEPPSGKRDKDAGPKRLCFSMEPAEAEQLRTALAAIRASAGVSREEVGDGALLAQMAARVIEELEHSEAPTGERFRIVIEHCPECKRTTTPEAEVSATHVGQACCDAEILDMREGPKRGHLSRTIPPATRRAVLQRDGHRCQVPGCTNRLWLDIHHVEYFGNGGSHTEWNLLTTCCTHHQLVHDGKLGIERDGDELVFRFADGRVVRKTHVAQTTQRPARGATAGATSAGRAAAPSRAHRDARAGRPSSPAPRPRSPGSRARAEPAQPAAP